ncbi:MAG: TonB-dependent hemoglobin/transferrin/lactoferrin family receptor [Halopseudomonas aestusnigri]
MQYNSFKGLLLASVALSLLSTPLKAQDNTPPNGDDSKTTIADQQPVFTFDAISVTASHDEKLAIETPASISIVTEQEIERRQARTVHDLLKDLPGVELDGGTRNTVQTPSIRGLGGHRVVTRIDGARHNFNHGHKGGLFIDPTILKQVEVLRGPSSTIHGSGALGGVVAFETKDADDFLEPDEKYGATISSGFGTVDGSAHGNLTGYARPFENVDLLASLTRKKSDDYDAGDGKKRAYTDDNFVSGILKGGVDIADFHRVGISYRFYNDDHVLPTTPDGTSIGNLVDRKSKTNSVVLDYDYENPDNTWFDTSFKGYFDSTALDEVGISDNRHDERDLKTYGLEAHNTSRFAFHDNVKLAVTLGGEIYRDTQEGTSNGQAIGGFPNAEQDIYGFYADNTLTLFDDLDLSAGLRFDSYKLEADGQEGNSERATSPRFSASYQVLPYFQPYVSYAEAFRAPSLGETYVTGQHFPGNFWVPNPNLKPETAKTWEFGANFKYDGLFSNDDKLRAKVSYFRNSLDDFIDRRVDFGGGTTTSSNVTKAQIHGFEGELHYDTNTVFGSLTAAHIRGKNTDSNEPLGNIPADKATVSLGYHFQNIGLDIGGRGIFASDQERVTNRATEYDGYATFDVFSTWDANDYVPGLKLNAGIDNILDTNYQRGSTVLDEPGRNFKVTASLKF